jgi:hypothetical protein
VRAAGDVSGVAAPLRDAFDLQRSWPCGAGSRSADKQPSGLAGDLWRLVDQRAGTGDQAQRRD